MTDNSKLFIYVLLLIAFAGAFAVLLSTRLGVGVSPDSVVYIGSARNLLEGQGLTVPFGDAVDEPLTHHAPLYAAVLSGFGFFQIDPLVSARWLNILLMASNIILVGILIRYSTDGPLWMPLFGAVAALLSTTFLTIHAMAWTEAAFIFFGLLAIFFLALTIDQSRLLYLLISAALAALTFLTRYAGIAHIFTGALGILILSKSTFRKRLGYAVIYGLIGGLPMALWVIRNTIIGGTSTNREFIFHPLGRENLTQAIDTFAMWLFLPSSVQIWMKLLITCLIVGSLISVFYFVRRRSPHPETRVSVIGSPPIIQLLLLFVIVYLAFLTFSISFLDANTPLDIRILSPVYVNVVILVFYLLSRLWMSVEGHRLVRVLTILVISGFLLVSLFSAKNQVTASYWNGIGLNNQAWRSSGTIPFVSQLPEDVIIYSNLPHVIYFFTGRGAYGLPKIFESAKQQANPDFFAEMDSLKRRVAEEDSYLVFFSDYRIPTLPGEQELVDMLSLETVTRLNDSTILRSRSGK